MRCPRCQNEMIEMANGDVKVDVCVDHCGGIWFDWLELKKVDESHEATEEFLESISKLPSLKAATDQKLDCPKCEGFIMMTHFFSVKKQVEVDECGNCGGFFLDGGELTKIHRTFATEEERKKAAHELFKEVFEPELMKMRVESENKKVSARKIANAFKYICPSYYIPGDQEGGAF